MHHTICHPRPSRSKLAFTLVETVLALGVLAFAIIPLVGLLSVGLQTQKDAIDQTVAAQIAQEIISDVRKAPFTDLPSLANIAHHYDEQGIVGVDPAHYIYRAELFVEMVTSIPEGATEGSDPGLATVTVQITKLSAPGQDVRFSVWVANNGF